MTESAKPDWSGLLERLESDLANRQTQGGATTRDDDAWEEVYRRITRYANVILRNRTDLDPSAAEDIAHGVLLKLQTPEGLSRVRAARAPAGYLMVVIRNAANDLARRRRIEREALARLGFELISATIPQPAPRPQRTAALARELARLSAEERELLRLRFWKNLSLGEIAAELRVSYSAVAVRMFRLLRRLRDRLALEQDGGM